MCVRILIQYFKIKIFIFRFILTLRRSMPRDNKTVSVILQSSL